jgi:Bacterial type II and III secretion system protein
MKKIQGEQTMKAVKTSKRTGSMKMTLLSVVLGLGLLLMGMSPAMSAQETKVDSSKSDSSKDSGPTYRLIYTLTEIDGTKRVGVQRFSTTVTPTERATVKVGSKVPIITGAYDAGSSKANTQFTYIDVGVNIDARLSPFANGMLLTTKVERLSVADASTEDLKPIAGFHEPVIRQAQLQNTALLQLGKSVMLGSLDTPGSERHVDVEVQLELVK